jgi:hypothetical protein
MFERFLQLLDKEQSEYARQALLTPRGQNAYDYGHAVGVYAGLERAREILDEMLRDKDARDNDL